MTQPKADRNNRPSSGWVALVGAGPGDPGLLTLRGRELLNEAEVVLCDGLVSNEIRSFISPAAQVMEVGKAKGRFSQSDINALLVAQAKAGKRVVRLKGGDPFLFGRGGEEVLALAKAGLYVEVVSGVSSAIAGPAAAGVPVTHRGLSSSVSFVTAREADGERQDWSVAAGAETVVILMGVQALTRAAGALIKEGKHPDTPAIIVEKATTQQQRIVRATLANIAEQARQHRIASPALIVVGAVASMSESLLPWMSPPRPKVLVTRAIHQSEALATLLRARGMEPVVAPAIRIARANQSTLMAALRAQARAAAEWVLFTSVNGVDHTFRALESTHLDARAFAGSKIAAVGNATANALAQHGLRADLIAKIETTRGLAEQIPTGEGLALLLRADAADDALPRLLSKKGYATKQVDSYRVASIKTWPKATRQLVAGGIEVITLASAETARASADLLVRSGLQPSSIPAVCIGSACAKGARAAGFRVARVSDEISMESLADAARIAVSGSRR